MGWEGGGGGGRGCVGYTSAQRLVILFSLLSSVAILLFVLENIIRASENRSGQVNVLSPLAQMATEK